MGQGGLEETLSLVSLDPEETGLVKPIRLFNPDEANRKQPQYDDPFSQRINEIINTDGYAPPFQIISAARTEEKGKRRLELTGKYETFDGLTVEVTFKGVYGDPKRTGLSPHLPEDDSFSSHDLEARVMGADSRQTRIFNMISLRDRRIRFREGRLRDTDPEHADFLDLSTAGLDMIRKIGKIVGIYEHLHIRDLISAILERRAKFEEELATIHFADYRLDLEVREPVLADEETNFLLRHFRSIAYEFIPVVSIKAVREISSLSTTTIHYDFAVGKEGAVWTIDVKQPLLNKVFAFHEKVRLANFEKPGSVKIDPGIDALHRRVMFVLDAFGFHFRDPNDAREAGYDSAFEMAVFDARREIREKDPGYKPLYLTAPEGNVYLLDGWNIISDSGPENRILRLRDKDVFAAFEMMMLEALTYKGKDKSMMPLVSAKQVQRQLDANTDLRRRVMTFYDIYRKDPDNAVRRYNESDPAYVRGRELDTQRHENFERQMRAERAAEGKSS